MTDERLSSVREPRLWTVNISTNSGRPTSKVDIFLRGPIKNPITIIGCQVHAKASEGMQWGSIPQCLGHP